ncbi:MAG: hypothetical protein RQ875_07270 [Vicingaceae bacterium]|nr:hypothetical protein [Vicingaceae bacterium]
MIKTSINQRTTKLNWINIILYLIILMSIFSCSNDKKEKIIVVDEDTKIKCEYTIVNNKKNDEYVCYYENEKISEKGRYVDDKLDGTVEEYYENGSLKSQTQYKMGVMDGDYRSYYKNGNLYEKVSYYNGVRLGYYERFDSIPQRLMLRVEYIKVPKEHKNYKFDDYVNRLWFFINGDTTIVSVDSEAYSIKSNENKKGIIIKCHFRDLTTSDNSSESDVKLDKVTLLIGDSVKKDTIDLNYHGQKRVDYNYEYKLTDIERGWIEGSLVGTYIYDKKVNGDSLVSYSSNRRLYFNWNIKDEKIINF